MLECYVEIGYQDEVNTNRVSLSVSVSGDSQDAELSVKNTQLQVDCVDGGYCPLPVMFSGK